MVFGIHNPHPNLNPNRSIRITRTIMNDDLTGLKLSAAPGTRRGQTPRHKMLRDNGRNIQPVIAILFLK